MVQSLDNFVRQFGRQSGRVPVSVRAAHRGLRGLLTTPMIYPVFETNLSNKSLNVVVVLEGAFSMLKLYATDGVRNRISLTYRGYDLELTRAPTGWLVGVHPRSADLPILSRSDFVARDEDRAVVQAKKRIDWVLLS